MKIKYSILFLLFSINLNTAFSQQKTNYKIAVVAFYNCEHFTDTLQKFFGEHTSKQMYTSDEYLEKLNNISKAISSIGINETKDGAALLGVADIGSRWVLRDIVNHSLLKNRNYQFVFDTKKDAKNIDVALIYNPHYFSVDTSFSLYANVKLKEEFYSNNILYVKGKLNGDVIHLYINHWTWRSSNEENNDVARWKAAMVCRNHIDSILQKDTAAKILLMGTFNDEPSYYSLAEILKAKDDVKRINKREFYNPYSVFEKKKSGSTMFNYKWAMFDEIILSQSFLNKQQDNWFYYQSKIFNENFLCEQSGKYAGYPSTSWIGNDYHGGTSSHFPVYISLLKKQ